MALAAGATATSVALALLTLTGRARRAAPLRVDPATLHRGNGAEPDSLDPNKIQGTWENNIVGDMFLGLMTEDAAARPIPGAARSYGVSPDGLTYRFKLHRHNWSDGRPVTAHDFVYSFRRIGDPRTAAQYVPLLYPIVNMQAAAEGKVPTDRIGVHAIDDLTLEMRFNYQVPYLMQLLTHQTAFPIPAHVVERCGEDWTKPEHIVTNGPYVLKQWLSNDHVFLARNPQFYDRDSVAIERVYFYPTQDSSAAIKRIRSGEFDLLTDTLPPQEADWLKRSMGHDLHLAPYMLSQYVQFNVRQKPFDDRRVRRALSLAINREIICDKVMRAGQTPAYAFLPPSLPDYPARAQVDFRAMPMPQRQATARWLLGQAGFGPSNPLVFDFNAHNTTEAKIVAVALQEMWRQVGVRTRIATSDSQLHYDLLRKRDFTAAWVGWVADYRDPKDYLFLFQTSSTDMNYGSWSNPAFDALLDRSDVTQDPAARLALLDRAEQILLDDVALAPVFFGVTTNLVSRQVKGWVDNAINIHRSRWLSLDRRVAAV